MYRYGFSLMGRADVIEWKEKTEAELKSGETETDNSRPSLLWMKMMGSVLLPLLP